MFFLSSMVNATAVFMLSNYKQKKEKENLELVLSAIVQQKKKLYLLKKKPRILKDRRYSVEGRKVSVLQKDKLYSKERN